jgi:SAM-dependent methyltransferase
MRIFYRFRRSIGAVTNTAGGALIRLSHWLGGHTMAGYDLIPRNQYDCVPRGTCVFGAFDKFLLVPKNRYRVLLLPNQVTSSSLGIGWITEDNDPSSYDKLWGDSGNLALFREEAGGVRNMLSLEIVDYIEVSIRDNAEVLDIGCGVGDLLSEVRRRRPSVKVSGLDFSGKAVEAAALAFPDGNFQCHVIERTLPYETSTFDVVMCTDVLEHLEWPRLIAAELVRICRPGGIVVIVVPDGDVDQFLGHYWFWNEASLHAMLGEWNPIVIRLPETREFLACIHIPVGGSLL